MKNRTLVADHIARATIRLAALDVLFDRGGYADVVRESQEVVELVGKALVRFLGAQPGRVHDVSSQLVSLQSRIDKRHRSGLAELIKTSKELRRDRELAFYGSEDLTPSEFYSKKDAERAREMAKASVEFVAAVTSSG